MKRVYIPKANGKLRPLGIPTIRDRVVQMAVLLVAEPIFEADFLNCSFGFRSGRSAHDALEEITVNLQQGRTEVYDADLQSYFDTIPHEKLMACVQKRIVDASVLKLIRMWLKAVIVEAGDRPGDPPKVSRSKRGTPQGGVISPLLANLYLHWFDKLFHRSDGPYRWANARLVRYADDFVILAKYSRYLNLFASDKSLRRERDKLREMTGPDKCFLPIPALIAQINEHLRGWSIYFGKGYPRKAFRSVNRFVQERLIRHLRRRSQRPFQVSSGMTWYGQLRRLGLVPL